MSSLLQNPTPGSRLLRCAGDDIEVTLSPQGPLPCGRAFVRTSASETSASVANACDATVWRDIEMTPTSDGRFAATIPFPSVGTFAFKAFFLPDGSDEPLWPHGSDVAVKVAPAHTRRSNSIYTAFVRQFTPDDGDAAASHRDEAIAFDDARWAAIPPSGTFRELARRLDHIIGTLGFHIVQLLPIHPVPTTYARMGRFGSPFASRDFFDVDPALAEFDEAATPMDQFVELADAIHARGARLFLDLPANHTGWASVFQTRHPEWFRREDDGRFHSPGAWGVTWADLVELDYSNPEVAEAMADVFLFWCAKGADGFRCDAGYMVPAAAWKTITGKVRRVFPDTVFMLEGLGGKLSVTDDLLSWCGLDWAYSELFQQYDRGGIEWYLDGALRRSEELGPLVNFAETHDNNRLAAHGPVYARMRTMLAALLSQQGCFGITAGVEWFCKEKVDVHGAPPLNWGAAENQVKLISRLNAILDACGAFAAGARVRIVTRGGANAIAALRTVPGDSSQDCLVAVNLDCCSSATVEWPAGRFPAGPAFDLLTGKPVELQGAAMSLPPGGATALVHDARLLQAVVQAENDRAVAGAASGAAPAVLQHGAVAPRHVRFRFPVDARRVVMVPPGQSLRIEGEQPFRALAWLGGKPVGTAPFSATDTGGTHFAIMDFSAAVICKPLALDLEVTGFGKTPPLKTRSRILLLPDAGEAAIELSADAARLAAKPDLQFNLANRRGAAAQAAARWGDVRSQYDALLAINPDANVPASRQVFLTRCRAWLRFRGHSYALDATTQTGAELISSREAIWRFAIPGEDGRRIAVSVALELAEASNAARLRIRRDDADGGAWPGSVTLILRPDVEARDFHTTTHAYTGPEAAFPAAVRPRLDGFDFTPDGRIPCGVTLRGATFHFEPEWTYCVGHPVEARRGLEPDGDLFSPGWLSIPLDDGGEAVLEAGELGAVPAWAQSSEPAAPRRLADWIESPAARDAIGLFLADRDEHRTVIAGFPWFLDWGRDTLIFLRGLIAAGGLDDALAILREFARFEEGGTLPNIIHGNVVGNRDTSDAPLWFVVAAGDLMGAMGTRKVAGAKCGERTIADAMLSIVRGYIAGTPNGVRVDPASGLVFSPPHFTWMDTNYPAGTPRAGYPVEIQALWIAALKTVRERLGGKGFAKVETLARSSFAKLFPLQRGWLADSLRTPNGAFAPAVDAIPEDAMRPNQLLAVTLGAIDPGGELARRVVDATALLLVPGSIRSLDDAPVDVPQPVWRDGSLLNDPSRPYWGRYEGDEDTRRKPAYHNGTAWGWMFPSWCEASAIAGGDAKAALAILASAAMPLSDGSLGQLPEICDGDAPHAQRGCLAQAWSISELIRVWRKLTNP